MRLFEQIVSQIYSSFRPHSKSVLNALENVTFTCHYVNEISSVEKQCEFVQTNGTCDYDGIFYSYTELTYCQLGHLRPVALIVLFLILLMLFVSIGSLADDFLCPSLLTISKTFRLPDHIAGVTFLAFGNSAPDIFSSISGISQSKPDLIFASLYGAGIFTTTVVTGCVLFSGEFAVMKMVLRDVMFYVGACFLVWIFIFFGKIKIAHSASLVGYYFVYIATLVVGRFFFMQFGGAESADDDIEGAVEDFPDGARSHSNSRAGDMEHDIKSVRSMKSIVHDGGSVYDINTPSRKHSTASHMSAVSTASTRKKIYTYENGIMLTRFYRSGSFKSPRRRSYSKENKHLAHHHMENTLNHIVKMHEADRKHGIVEDARYTETIEKEQAERQAELELKLAEAMKEQKKSGKYTDQIKFTNNFGTPKYLSQFSTSSILSARSWMKAFSETKEFFIHISPVDFLEWHQYKWYQKVIEIVKSVPYFIMTLCIPVVDIESPNENWCRLLICLNIICAPQIVLFLYGVSASINSFPLWALLFLISFAIAVIVLIFSERAKPPAYHRVFGFVGFVMSVVFINAIAEEVISVLSTFGIIFGLSDSILGLTVLAWGNSLGDFIANNSLARQGYPGIAIAACLGGPLLNMLLGVGLPYTILIIGENRSEVEVHYTSINTLLFATIMTSLFTTIGFFLFYRFKSSRIHSFVLIGIYVAYVVMAVLLEFNVFG